jgi:hypothetical protein
VDREEDLQVVLTELVLWVVLLVELPREEVQQHLQEVDLWPVIREDRMKVVDHVVVDLLEHRRRLQLTKNTLITVISE